MVWCDGNALRLGSDVRELFVVSLDYQALRVPSTEIIDSLSSWPAQAGDPRLRLSRAGSEGKRVRLAWQADGVENWLAWVDSLIAGR